MKNKTNKPVSIDPIDLNTETGLTNNQMRKLADNLKLDSSGKMSDVLARVERYLNELPQDVKKFLSEFKKMKQETKKEKID